MTQAVAVTDTLASCVHHPFSFSRPIKIPLSCFVLTTHRISNRHRIRIRNALFARRFLIGEKKKKKGWCKRLLFKSFDALTLQVFVKLSHKIEPLTLQVFTLLFKSSATYVCSIWCVSNSICVRSYIQFDACSISNSVLRLPLHHPLLPCCSHKIDCAPVFGAATLQVFKSSALLFKSSALLFKATLQVFGRYSSSSTLQAHHHQLYGEITSCVIPFSSLTSCVEFGATACVIHSRHPFEFGATACVIPFSLTLSFFS